jgi:hypothetical protein
VLDTVCYRGPWLWIRGWHLVLLMESKRQFKIAGWPKLGIWLLGYVSLAVMALGQQRLSGVIDLHAHCDPDSVPRSIDALDLARLAQQAGMLGLVLKNHFEPTAMLAYLVRKEVPGIEVFGGIVLNRSVGGINPVAIERMAQVKGGWGKVVWLPTIDAENQVQVSKSPGPFVSVAKDGRLLPEVLEVLALVEKYDLLLETGHSSAEESLLVVREAKRLGVHHVVVTHAMISPVSMTTSQMQTAAREGALLEFVYGATLGSKPQIRIEAYARAIRAVGPDGCILSSDLGQPGNPLHPAGLEAFFEALRKEGFTQAELDTMAKTNPASALGLR